MTYELYRGLFYACLILAGILFCLAVFLFFRLNIIKIIGDLSGRNARKAIEDIRKKNEEMNQEQREGKGWNHTYSQKLTDKISKSGRLVERESGMKAYTYTQKIRTQSFPGSEETVVLQEMSHEGETVLLRGASNEGETVVLREMSNAGETVLLKEVASTQDLHVGMLEAAPNDIGESDMTDVSYLFEIEYEIEFIHTEEEIALC